MCIPVVNLTAVSQLPQDLHPLVNSKTQRNRSDFIQIMQVSVPADAVNFFPSKMSCMPSQFRNLPYDFTKKKVVTGDVSKERKK